MRRCFLNSKIHGAVCTDVDLNYEGSILIDEDWMDEVGLLIHEQVDVYNKTMVIDIQPMFYHYQEVQMRYQSMVLVLI